MKSIVADKSLVAMCGLYCGACKSYLKGRCPGCHKNAKASWCKVRTCCGEHAYLSCADCKEVVDFMACKKLNNPIAKVFALIFGSDRPASLRMIRESGYEKYAEGMADRKMMSAKRGVASIG